MSHPDHVEGWNGTLEELAQAIGNMRYDTIAQFIDLLSNDIRRQSGDDWKRGRRRLSIRLNQTAHDLSLVKYGFSAAWKICEPYMDENQGQVLADGEITNQ